MLELVVKQQKLHKRIVKMLGLIGHHTLGQIGLGQIGLGHHGLGHRRQPYKLNILGEMSKDRLP